MTPHDFVQLLAPAARANRRDLGIPASFTVAEAALESGWGQSLLALKANNLFGIKADSRWMGPTLVMRTREFRFGKWVMIEQPFRKYATLLDSLSDHAAFLRSNPRYSLAFLQRDAQGFARAVAAAGYATDPEYAEKLIRIMRDHDLIRLDDSIAAGEAGPRVADSSSASVPPRAA